MSMRQTDNALINICLWYVVEDVKRAAASINHWHRRLFLNREKDRLKRQPPQQQ